MVLLLTLGACRNNEEQNNFEQEAFERPFTGITETNVNAEILDEDPDDWRVSPFYAGLLRVTPAFPNPITTNQRFTVELNISALESVNGLEAVAFDENNRFVQLFVDVRNPLPPGFISFTVDPLLFTNTGVRANAAGLHRVWIYDLNDNLITYGDIRVQ